MESVSSQGTVNLLDEDEDEDEESFCRTAKRNKNMNKKIKDHPLIIILSDDDEDDGGGKMPPADANDDSDVMIIEPEESTDFESREFNAFGVARATPSKLGGNDMDDEVQTIGLKNTMHLPHMRQHCEECKFVPDGYSMTSPSFLRSEGNFWNPKFCNLCYCFVCDIPSSECKFWTSDGNKSPKNHCLASDRGKDQFYWKDQRKSRKRSQAPTVTPPTPERNMGFIDAILERFDPDDECALRSDYSPSLPPDSTLDPLIRRCLTQCRKCKWYTKFQHENYTRQRNVCVENFSGRRVPERGPHSNPVGTMDWCHSCGRVASEKDFGKEQSKPYEPEDGDISLGTKEIPFRIKAHDPRKIIPFKSNWEKFEGSPGWDYDEVDTEEDFFHHRIGKHPKISLILSSIPITEEDIPEEAKLIDSSPRGLPRKMSPANETEALLLDNKRDVTIFQELLSLTAHCTMHCPLSATIESKWDRKTRKGTIIISLFIKKSFLDKTSYIIRSLMPLLGSWFGVFPFKLSDLTNGRLVNTVSSDDESFTSVEAYNDEARAIFTTHSFKSSNGTGGGVCENDNTFSGMLRRYCRETFVNDCDCRETFANDYDPFRELNSSHRSVRRRDDVDFTSSSFMDLHPINFYLNEDDFKLVSENKTKLSNPIKRNYTSFGGLLQQLENLGHTEVDHIDGLNVELFDFQSQAVRWALEREQASNGINSYLYATLPHCKIFDNGSFRATEIYYSPVINCFKTKKPEIVRGGIIGAEMGLGKTIISLALVLHNPAPPLPESGSDIKTESHSGKLSQTIKPKKTGRIFSRGTLVVCNVTLVGQWIDEAKSKLKDPGLVYSYYGSNRTRDPSILAKNAIIVTTYAVLASDAVYHRRKSNDPDYCPPCEQVKWWRIICDESHCLKSNQTGHYLAVSSLSAVNKWCVTGTPVNTSLTDLKGQLKIIGLKDTTAMFTVFQKNMPSHFNQRKRRWNYDPYTNAGNFLFAMRNILIRYSIKQQGKLSNTDIMSLPPKEETDFNISFNEKERREYEKLEAEAQVFYNKIKCNGVEMRRQYLKLLSALIPLRVACSGGRVDEERSEEKENDEAKLLSNHLENKTMKNEGLLTDIPFKSKFLRLLQELERIRIDEPSSKCLIFSQFKSTLAWIQQELPKHGFQFRTLSGDMSMSKRAKALREFQNDPPTTVFLLSMRAGAVGINLTQANRVFIMEPATNPALEAQAIGRVYRLGQRKRVQVIRLYMDNSFETRLLSVLDKKYGSKKENTNEIATNASKNEEGDLTSDSADAACVQVVGHMIADKTDLLVDEFDTLFGVKAQNEDQCAAVMKNSASTKSCS